MSRWIPITEQLPPAQAKDIDDPDSNLLLLNLTTNLLDDRALAIRITKCGWLCVLFYGSYLLLSSKSGKRAIGNLKIKAGDSQMLSYVIVAAAGATLSVIYWAVINGVYAQFIAPSKTAETQAKPTPKTETSLSPSRLDFHPSPDGVTVQLGSQPFRPARAGLVNGSAPLQYDDYAPVRMYEKDGKLYVDVIVLSPNNAKPAIEYKQNNYIVRPHNWDTNSNEKVFEVVDENQRPMLQLIKQNESHIIIYGVFPINGRFHYADKRGFISYPHPLPPKDLILKPIFKYPAWKHQGEYAE